MSQRPGPSKGAAESSRSRGWALAVSGMVGASARFACRRPLPVLTAVAVIGGAGIFTWNATMQQTVRHPAPLFGSPKPAAPKPVASAKSDPPPQLQQKRADLPSPQTTGATRPDAPIPPRRPAGPDAIGSIVRTGEGSARPGEARASDVKPGEAKPAPQPRVASAQKALAKLGYGPIAADGVLGAHTKQALERFERDKKLPVTGTLGPRTAKQLASLSGIAVQ